MLAGASLRIIWQNVHVLMSFIAQQLIMWSSAFSDELKLLSLKSSKEPSHNPIERKSLCHQRQCFRMQTIKVH